MISARIRPVWCTIILTVLTLAQQSNSQAQGLVWSIPEPGTSVKYAGTYSQVTFRPQSSKGDLSLEWRSTLETRCLERVTANYHGEDVPCVWLEFEAVTGQLVDGSLESGPGGQRIYKVLVPESAINGLEFFRSEVPNAYLPVVEGYEKIGDGKVERFKLPVLQVFPLLTQLLINDRLKDEGQENVTVTTGEYPAQKVTCQTGLEDPSTRTTNQSQIWISDQIPFGLVKWQIRIDREVKTPADTRDQFQKSSEISIDMQAVEITSNATSKLSTPAAE
ncbi:MAG: hypothetical protein KDA78_11715 [Planctomycetaceae bacterium]|nr:hypothetical protein [Planctomycetaceae bacterium]